MNFASFKWKISFNSGLSRPSDNNTTEECPFTENDVQMTNSESLTCGNCDELLANADDLKHHQSSCGKSFSVTAAGGRIEENPNSPMSRPSSVDHSTMVDVSKEDHISEVAEDVKHSQDAVNNNLHDDEEVQEPSEKVQENVEEEQKVSENSSKNNHRDTPEAPEEDEENTEPNASLPGSFPQSHVTLEALQNTKVAVAQFAANALAGAGNGDPEAALKDLAVLHSTLFQLQHQHVFQLQLIQQLQSQLSMSHRASSKAEEEKDDAEDKQMDNQSEAMSEKRDDDDEEDFGKLEPEVIISR